MKWWPKLLAWQSAVTDEEAMRELAARDDHEAFTLLVHRWELPIRRLCIRMTGDEHRGEELAQDAFARVFTQRHQYAIGRRFSTWLWRIALNLCFEEGRRAARRGKRYPAAEMMLADTSPSGMRGPADEVIGREQIELVRNALSLLTDEFRTVVVLREYEGLKYREIAEVLEIPEGTVKWRMAKALDQLGRLLKPIAPEDVDRETQNVESIPLR